MKEIMELIAHRFNGLVNVLIVDDERQVLKSLKRNFISPLFRLSVAESYDEAMRAIVDNHASWHCWVLDIDLSGNHTCLEIMNRFPRFPFVIVLSGLQSMHRAAEAIQKGAFDVFDKDPESFERFYDETCKTAALGFLLGGKQTQYLPLYRLLCKSVITSIEAWAEHACVSVRQLHRITELHPVNTPKASLALYYGMYYLLYKGMPPFDETFPRDCFPENANFFEECLAYCSRNF